MKLVSYCNRVIEYSFYVLFLLVPLFFAGAPSELFEFPKMWLTFVITILITSSWFAKMIFQRRIHIQRTPLDIPLLLFLIANIVSTIFSLDPHVSLWGFYSRFNGGLLSIISYIFLYYAFVSNLSIKHAFTILKVSLFAGLLVAVWGLPSHFGWDPTCYVFRGSFDTTCWTEAFRPTIRIFSTLGQPAWLAAYMSVLIPIAIAFAMKNSKLETRNSKQSQNTNNQNSKRFGNLNLENSNLFRISDFGFRIFLPISLLFYACLTYTDTRGGFIGFWIANLVFWAIIHLKKLFRNNFLKYFLTFNLLFLIFNFFSGIPISQLSGFTLPELSKNTQSIDATPTKPQPAAGALGGTDSGKIRLLVWKGAIDAWKEKPFFGTGVETFAYAYYKSRPIEHNLTSEWDYLYNKAHNEYLNYLTTTGIFGLGSYLAIVGVFLFQGLKYLNSKLETRNSKPDFAKASSGNAISKEVASPFRSFSVGGFRISDFGFRILIFGLIAGYISILVSNFFGFSVVIINLYFFLIPAFVFILGGMLSPEKILIFPNKKLGINLPAGKAGNQELRENKKITALQWLQIVILLLTSYFLLLSLYRYWVADIAYANGSNLNKGGAPQDAYPYLVQAVSLKNNEPIYKDELSLNMGTLAAALYLQKDASSAAELKNQAIALSDEVVRDHPNNIVFWKSRVRLFYTLAQGDPAHEKSYYAKALKSIEKSQELAPNDAKISYNLGVLMGQTGDFKKAIPVLENTVRIKPNYRDAYFALGLFYEEAGEREKAIQAYEYILKNIDPQDEQVKESLKSWGK
ncbi:MAG TPA: O-antigen ligase family protein [Xanthomonadales bacterium]|nr:O-antigen ligase family protein [Xanthomonadales bacterium]